MGDQTIIIPDPGTTTVTVDTPANAVVTQPVTPTGTVVVQASGLLGPPPAGVNPFTSLTDVPSSYAGFETYKVVVKADGSGLEFVVDAGGGGGGGVWGAITGSIASQTDLITKFNGYALISSLATVATTGAYGNLSGLPTLGTAAAQASTAFAAAVHTHAAGDIVSGTLADARIAASNVTQHQASLSINWSQMTGTVPPLLITKTAVVASQVAQLALTAEEGDLAIRTDLNKTYAKNTGVSGTMADWSELLSPTAAVSSVFGRTGAVGAQTGDYTFAQISTTPTTLAGYGITDAALLASPTFTGTPSGPTAAPGTNTTQFATTGFVEAARVILAAADALKSPIASPTFTGVPAGPTAAAATNTTQLATTAFATTADNLKANLASPTFTGTPAAPTAAAGTNTTQLATTAFVTAGLALAPKLAAVNTFTKAQAVTPVALTSGATVSVDGSLSNNFTLTLATNATLANPTNLVPGTVYNFVVTQDGTGTRTLAYGSLYKWPGGTAGVLSTAAGSVDMLSCLYDGTRLLCQLNKAYA